MHTAQDTSFVVNGASVVTSIEHLLVRIYGFARVVGGKRWLSVMFTVCIRTRPRASAAKQRDRRT